MNLHESQNGWSEYQRLVLAALERHDSHLESIDEKIGAVRMDLAKLQVEIATEIATLKVKSGLWGALAGVITVMIALGIKLITSN
jgi:uncharacterized membrane protein